MSPAEIAANSGNKSRTKQKHVPPGAGSGLTSVLNQPPTKKLTPGMKKLAELQSNIQKEAQVEQMQRAQEESEVGKEEGRRE